MPNIKSAKKRVKVINTKTMRNKAVKSDLKTALKKADAAVAENAENKEEVVKFCKENIKLLSMDNIVSFMSEVKMLEDEDISLQEIINIMNISTENIPTKVSDTVEYDDECDDCDECNDGYDDYECCDAA